MSIESQGQTHTYARPLYTILDQAVPQKWLGNGLSTTKTLTDNYWEFGPYLMAGGKINFEGSGLNILLYITKLPTHIVIGFKMLHHHKRQDPLNTWGQITVPRNHIGRK